MGNGRTATPTQPRVSRPAVDRCPGVLRLHDAGDGLLARVRVPGGRLDAAALDALAQGAALGNGLAELTSRASVQLRGLPASAAGPMAGVLARGGLLPSRAHDRARNVLASPLGGRLARSLVATDPLVRAFDEALCADAALAALPARLLFAIDDGAGLVDLWAVDVGLVPERVTLAGRAGGRGRAAASDDAEPSAPLFRLWLAGLPTALTVAPDEAVALLLRVARTFMAVRVAVAPTAWHVSDLPDGPSALAAALNTAVDAGAAPSATPLSPGTVTQRDGRVAVTALPPLARLERGQLVGLSALLRELGLADVRVAPNRTVTVPDVPAARAEEVRGALEALGLVVDRASGWRGLTACSGLGACRRALIDVRAAAVARAALRGPDAPSEHWSACGRRCGMKRDVAVGIVASETAIAVRAGGREREAADVEQALELLRADRAAADVAAPAPSRAAGNMNVTHEGPTA
jgi:sulfite reductase beta subunit-like hemoprotein